MKTETLTLRDVAAELGVCLDTVRRWVRAGRLPAVHVDYRSYGVRRADLTAWLASRGTVR